MAFTLKPLTPHMGVELTDFDPREPFDDATARDLYDLIKRHRVLLFRAKPLTEEQQVRLTCVAGEVTYRGGGNYADPEMKSWMVSNYHADGQFGNGELSFHSDLSFTPHMLKARSLHGIAVPSSREAGGETLFSDVIRAYEELDDTLKARVENLRARFSATYNYPDGRVETLDQMRPLIETHPFTGQRLIAASRAVTKEVIGMEREEFRPLLKQLWAQMEKPEYVLCHSWSVGDTVLWDNIGTQHARTPFDSSEKRALRAVSVDDPSISIRAKDAANSAKLTQKA